MPGRVTAVLTAIAAPLVAGVAAAGGPLIVDTDGSLLVWGTASAIPYRTDGGPLSSQVTNAQAQTRVRNMFDVWQDVASASISYSRAGAILDTGVFTDGDVSTAAEFNDVEGDCFDGNQSPIVFDVDGSMFEDLGEDPSVIGFAGPCAANGAGNIVSGRAVMNGIYLDGIDSGGNPELTSAEFDAAFVHEFGHLSGLDHSQININCLQQGCGNDNLEGLPTMFPILLHASQGSLSTDDIAWISRLYPAGGASGFAATHGTIRGIVYFSDGESHVQFANVIARQVEAGGNEDRRIAVSNVAGYRFRACVPNDITPPPPSFYCPQSGSLNPGHTGLFEIPVPAGTYTLEIESIDPAFTGGSRVGPGDRPLPLPGTVPPPSAPISIAAGETKSGNHVTLIGTPPRFDSFESP
jgi:hypothetical protein